MKIGKLVVATIAISDKTTIWPTIHPLITNNQYTTILVISFLPNKSRPIPPNRIIPYTLKSNPILACLLLVQPFPLLNPVTPTTPIPMQTTQPPIPQ